MNTGTRILGRTLGTTGLAALSALHVVWAAGSPWPARSTAELAEAVSGQALPGRSLPGHSASGRGAEMPLAAATALVAAGTAGAGLLASGALGDGGIQRIALRTVATAMLLRSALGGGAALAALGLPPAGETFRRLDNRWYRPFAAALGVSLLLASGAPRRATGS
ncbi:DUF3995 domain-containing protein [Paeniglutamicibacter sp. R2-26]|uniref:DUF3995 domain-containing protein n=1 Tax=Paeniglutamicibacter sp. R2-26 TaxID=3144417 RepID=UPI003EE61003